MYEWSDLRIFLAVAREGSTLAASRSLCINQTTVSRRIQVLEHGLGLTLFQRDTRGCVLTSQAKELVARAEAVEVAAQDVETEARRLTRDLSGVIRVTAPESIMTHIISPLITVYRENRPEVRFDYLSAEHRLNLEKGEADVAFRATLTPTGDTLIAQRLPDIIWSVYCAESYAARYGKPSGPQDLKDHLTVAYGERLAGRHFSIEFMKHVCVDKVAATCNSIPNMAGALRAGLGVGLLTKFDGDATPGLVECFQTPPEFDDHWWLMVAPEAHQQPRVRDFVTFAAAHILLGTHGLRP